VLFLIPVGLYLYLNWGIIQQGVFPEGDWATLSIMTRRALSFDQFLGNYSRFGWSHPGPFIFYIIGALSIFFKNFATPEMAAVFCYQVVFFYMSYRLLISLSGLFAGIMLIAIIWLIYIGMIRIYPAELFRTLFFNYWAPLLTLFPMLFFLLIVASAASGRTAAMLPMVISAAILPQIHIGTSFHAAFLFGFGMYLMTVLDKKNNGRKFFVSHRNLLLASLFVLILIWILPLYEAVTNSGGNLLKVFNFFFSKDVSMGHGPSFAEAIQYLLAFYALPLQTLMLISGIDSSISPQILAFIAIMLYFVICLGVFKNIETRQKILCSIPWVFLLVSIPSVLKIRGERYPYLMYWQFANVALLYAVALGALYRTIAETLLKFANSRVIRLCDGLLPLILLACICTLLSGLPHVSFGADRPPKEFFAVLSKWISGAKDEVRLSSGDHTTWPYVAGILNASLAAELPVCVPDNWLWVYGKLSSCRESAAQREIIFFDDLDTARSMKDAVGRNGTLWKIENPSYKARYLLTRGFQPDTPQKYNFPNRQTRVSMIQNIQ